MRRNRFAKNSTILRAMNLHANADLLKAGVRSAPRAKRFVSMGACGPDQSGYRFVHSVIP